MFSRTLISAICLFISSLSSLAIAGSLEDMLLASATARLDQKGVELAIRRGAKLNQKLPHPDAAAIVRTPVQFTLSALIDSEEPDSTQRVERILKMLFKAGAKLTGDKDELFSPISGGHKRIVTLLLEQGANPHARIYGYTLAELAIKYGHPTLLPIFYARGVPAVDAITTAQIQFVDAAGRQQLAEMQAALMSGAKINDPDPAGYVAIVQIFSTPLRGQDGGDAVNWLLFDAGANVNAIEFADDKSTALHNLIRRNSYRRGNHFVTAEIVELLLRRGAVVSAVDSMGRTPLHYAAQSGNTHAIEVLVRNGAKVMARDSLGKSPLDLAESGDAILLLRAAGAHE